MPTKTFDNLPQEKKARLIGAIRQELARVPVEEISINKIIARADISRGSYYQYFSGKEDLISLVMQDFGEMLQIAVVESAQKREGDIILIAADVLHTVINFTRQNDNLACYRNVFSFIKIHSKWPQQVIHFTPCLQELKARTQLAVNTDNLRLEKPRDLSDMLEILTFLLLRAIAEYMMDITQVEVVKEGFYNKLEILKRGMQR